MSHVAHIEGQFHNIDALREALGVLGLTLETGGTARYYGGASDPCDFVVRLPGKYDLGFKDGGLVVDKEAMMDRDNGRNTEFRRYLGDKADRLYSEYGWAMAQRQARKLRGRASRHFTETGEEEYVINT